MARIVLATLNAKYIHSALGLRYLLANLGSLRAETELLEFEIHQSTAAILERILSRNPRVLGLGVYIWNVTETGQLVAALKKLRPGIRIILGGPEVSYPPDLPGWVEQADYVITGEADQKFAEVCGQLLDGAGPAEKIIVAGVPNLAPLALPYTYYSPDDIAHRILYVEASRGCPFTCEFCLSSLDVPVRQFPLAELLTELDRLLKAGARHLKFVDRTFNLNIAASQAILEFFLSRYQPGNFFHFEMVPDRLPEGLRAIIRQFPPGALQFEVGIQTFSEKVASLIHRRQNYARLEENIRFLREHTSVYIHADLIAGLPGETFESFGAGFDRLIGLRPQEIQVGLLKRLRGTPIIRHDAEWGMVYNPSPPYEILETRLIDFTAMQTLRRFARFWDLIGNSGNFLETTPMIWAGEGSPFAGFLACSEWLFARLGRGDSVALDRLMELLLEFFTGRGMPLDQAGAALARDYLRPGGRHLPVFLQPFGEGAGGFRPRLASGPGPKRQARRLSRQGAGA